MRVRSSYVFMNRGYIIIVKKLTILTHLSSPAILAIALVGGGGCACRARNEGLRPRSGIVVRRA